MKWGPHYLIRAGTGKSMTNVLNTVLVRSAQTLIGKALLFDLQIVVGIR